MTTKITYQIVRFKRFDDPVYDDYVPIICETLSGEERSPGVDYYRYRDVLSKTLKEDQLIILMQYDNLVAVIVPEEQNND